MSGKGKKRTAIKIFEVYGDLIEGAPDSIVAVDLKGNITYCNKATENLTGYGKEELIGKHFSRVGWIKNKEISHCLKLFKALLSNKKVAPFEMEISHKDGKSCWVEVHLSKIKAKGKVAGFRVNVRDITDCRQMEKSLKQKVLELNSFINNIPDMVWLKDDKSRFIALNKAFGEVAGMKPETLIGQTCEVCFGVKAGKKFREDDLKVMKGRRQVSIEEKILDSKGNELWLETIKSPIFGESGKVMGTVGIARNVTERKRTEDQLGKLSRAVEQSPSIVMITDTKGTIEYVNPKFTQITGYTPEEIIGTNAHDLGEQTSEEQKQMWNIITSGDEWRGEFHNKKKNGELYWEFASISHIKNRKGLITHFLKVAEDITERKRVEEALIRGERIATERARFLTDLRSLDRIDDVLTRVCEAVRDSGLFERAVMTLHDQVRQIAHLGQVGLPPDVVKRARQAPPIDQNLRTRVTSKKFRISNSLFIPAEAGIDFSKTGRYVPQKKKNSTDDSWQPGDELFVPLSDFSGKIMGYLSVDTPTDGSRPDVKTIQALEMLVEAAAARVREVEVREALKRERDFSQSILKTANSLIVCLDADANIMAFNQECEKVTGYRLEEVLGKRWPELFLPPDQRHAKLKSFARWVRAHPRDQYEGPIVTKSGEIRTILWSNTAILGSGEKDVIAIAIGHDITKRKRAEKALQISQERYELSTKAANAGVWDWDIKANRFYIDPNVKEILGYKDKEIPNDIEVWTTHIHPDDLEPVMAAAQACLDGKTPEYVFEHRMMHKDGSIRWILTRGNVIRDAKGTAVRMVGTDTDITERKRTEEALLASENKYRTLLENLPQKIFLKDKNSVYLSCNENFAKDLKIKAEEFAGKTDYDFFPRELAEKYRADDKRIMKLGKTEDIEERYIQEGREVIVHTVKTPVKDEQGNLIGLLGIFWDVTERKRTEEALRESEQRFRTISTTAKDAILMMDNEGNISYWNPAAEKIFGYLSQEVMGKELHILLASKRYHEAYRKGFSKFKKTGQGVAVGKTLEFEAIRKDGTQFPIELSLSAIKIKDRWHAVAIVRDITERKRAEEALRESEKKYRTLVETAQEGIGITDPEENLTFVNQAFADMLGYKKEKLLGKNLSQVSDEEEFAKFRKETQKRKQGKSSKYEAELFTKRGKPRYFYVSAVPVRTQNGRFNGTLGVLTDITELKRAREQNLLLETSKTLSRTLKLDRVLKIATKKMAQALKADRCAVAFTDPNMHSATVKHIYLEDGSPSPDLLGFTLYTREFYEANESLRTKRHYQILNTRTDPIQESLRKYLLRVRVKSCLIIPMFIGEKLLGLFNIGSVTELRNFTKEEIGLAQTIANQVAVAVENSLLLEDIKGKHDQIAKQTKVLERQYREQAILMKISRELSKTLNLDRILEIATKETTQALQVDRCAVALAFPEEGYAELRSVYMEGGRSVDHLLGYRLYPHNFPQAKEMLEKRGLISIPDIYHLPDKSFAKKYFIKEGIKSALFAPMVHGKKLVGFFVLSTMKDFKTFTREETKLAQTIADQTAVAIENARLLELVRKSEEDLRALNVQLINVQEDERKKLAQELHDEIGQMLFAMKMNLDVTKNNLPTNIEKLEDIKNRLSDTEDLLSQTIDRIRNLTTDLRPSMLDDFGLIPALKWYIDNFSKRTNIRIYIGTKNFKGRLSSEIETTLYRIIQEALTNAAKHAQATEISILLSLRNSIVSLSLQDNGIGFDTKKITFSKDRFGLFSIKERVKLLNGEFEIRSKPNKGTKLSVKIPLVERRV